MSKYYSIPPQLYDDQFWWKKDDIEFWKSVLLEDSRKTILELGAGTGRLAGPLATAGSNYMGLDISKEYVEYAQQKFSKIKNIEFIQADMIDFNLKKTFDSIFIGFNSFLHLIENKDAYRCLDSVKNHMHATTKLFIDIFVPHPLILHRPEKLKIHILDFYNNTSKKEQSIAELLRYNSQNEVADIEWYYANEDGTITDTFIFKMRMYYPDTMNKMIIESGLRIIDFWGSYEKTNFIESSNLQIYSCQLI